ncbi:hypothetical protein [Xanthomonas albilineans]|uniref:hypothetical protein n=1 Tax=Xanthomonas albilineans TaxID=29447 RepID=UPI000B09D046|nr:hypothetical protein [Xanthomonas albilineans]
MKHLELAPPATLSASGRAQEITTILAAAIVRTFVAQVRPSAESGLGFLPDQSVYTTPYQQEFS